MINIEGVRNSVDYNIPFSYESFASGPPIFVQFEIVPQTGRVESRNNAVLRYQTM